MNTESYAQTSSSDIHMEKSAGTYDLTPPNLTDSEFESDSEADETEEANFKRQPDPIPDVRNYAKMNKIGSKRVNPKNDYDPTTVIRNT